MSLIEESKEWLDYIRATPLHVHHDEDELLDMIDDLIQAIESRDKELALYKEVVSLARVTHFNAAKNAKGNYVVAGRVMDRLEIELTTLSNLNNAIKE